VTFAPSARPIATQFNHFTDITGGIIKEDTHKMCLNAGILALTLSPIATSGQIGIKSAYASS